MIVDEIERLTYLKRDPNKEGTKVFSTIMYNYNTYVNNYRKLCQITTMEEKINTRGGLRKAYDEISNR